MEYVERYYTDEQRNVYLSDDTFNRFDGCEETLESLSVTTLADGAHLTLTYHGGRRSAVNEELSLRVHILADREQAWYRLTEVL